MGRPTSSRGPNVPTPRPEHPRERWAFRPIADESRGGLILGEVCEQQLPSDQRDHDGSGRVRSTQAPPDLGEVLLHGRLGEPQALCNLGRTEALRSEPEDLTMTFREHHR